LRFKQPDRNGGGKISAEEHPGALFKHFATDGWLDIAAARRRNLILRAIIELWAPPGGRHTSQVESRRRRAAPLLVRFPMSVEPKQKILVLCSQNSARSQMAEGLFRKALGDRFQVFSAGIKPTYVRPEAIEVMREIGIDISGHRSKSVDEFLGQEFRYVITVCDEASESCPTFPGKAERIHWSIEDPATVHGSEQDRKAAFRRARDQIAAHIEGFAQTGG